MFYEKKRIYSREVSKRSCKNDMNPESQTLLEVHFIFYSPFFVLTGGLFVILQPQCIR